MYLDGYMTLFDALNNHNVGSLIIFQELIGPMGFLFLRLIYNQLQHVMATI